MNMISTAARRPAISTDIVHSQASVVVQAPIPIRAPASLSHGRGAHHRGNGADRDRDADGRHAGMPALRRYDPRPSSRRPPDHSIQNSPEMK